jgi:hypothetical protein
MIDHNRPNTDVLGPGCNNKTVDKFFDNLIILLIIFIGYAGLSAMLREPTAGERARSVLPSTVPACIAG